MFREVAAIYRQNKKQRDNLWTQYVCRPAGAVLVRILAPLPVTPNQVTFASYFVFLIAALMTVFLQSWGGLIAAMAVLEFSYILDCADGMLARHRRTASPLGHLLDFLMDELKAGLLLGAVALRLFLATEDILFLITGIIGLVVVNSGISLTTFTRRPQFPGASQDIDKGARDAAGLPPDNSAESNHAHAVHTPKAQSSILVRAIHTAISLFERLCKFIIHYPSYVLILALFNRIDLYFYAYLAVNALYLGRMFLLVLRKLGMSASPITAHPQPAVLSPAAPPPVDQGEV